MIAELDSRIVQLDDWLRRERSFCRSLAFNGMYREVANRDGPTALMLYPDLLEAD